MRYRGYILKHVGKQVSCLWDGDHICFFKTMREAMDEIDKWMKAA